MKFEHKLGEAFKATRKDGTQLTMVAIEGKSVYDKTYDTFFRVSCGRCIFARKRMMSCSGHRYMEETCMLGGCKYGKCSPEYRTDGKYIEYIMQTNV